MGSNILRDENVIHEYRVTANNVTRPNTVSLLLIIRYG